LGAVPDGVTSPLAHARGSDWSRCYGISHFGEAFITADATLLLDERDPFGWGIRSAAMKALTRF